MSRPRDEKGRFVSAKPALHRQVDYEELRNDPAAISHQFSQPTDPETHSGALHIDLLPPEPKGPTPRWIWAVITVAVLAWAAAIVANRLGWLA